MAQLPDLLQSERPAPQPAGGLARYQADFGGGEALGQANVALGKSMSGVGDVIFERAKVEQEKMDTLKAEEAFTALRQKQLDRTIGESGYQRLKGSAAVNEPIFDRYTKDFKGDIAEIEKTLKTPAQIEKFRQRSNVANLQFQEGILRHTITEADAFSKQVAEGVLTTETRQVTANWQSPMDVQLSLINIDEALKQQAERFGWAPEFLEAQRLKAHGQAHTAVVTQAIASGNLVYAQEWYEEHKKDVDLPTAKLLETATRNGLQKQITNEYDGKYLAAKDDIGQLRALESELLRDGRIEDSRKRILHGPISSRLAALEQRAQVDLGRIEKHLERGIAKVNSITASGYEAPAEDVQSLFELSRGTPMQGEVDRMIGAMHLTQRFSRMSPGEQSAELTRMTTAARTGGSVTTEFGTFAALRQAIQQAESGGQADPANAKSPENKGGEARARGSMQITEGTFTQYAAPGESFDNEQHRVNAAIRKLTDDFNFYKGDVEKTAAAYIGGRGSVAADGSIAAGAGSADVLGTTPRAYANKVKAAVDQIVKSSGGMRFDIGVLQNLERMHESMKKDIRDDFVTFAQRRGLIKDGDPAGQTVDMSKPDAITYEQLSRRAEIAAVGEARYGALNKPLTQPERDVAVATLRALQPDGKVEYFAKLLKVASNRGDDPVGMRNDAGGIRTYKAIMAQIAPDEPVLAHAGEAAGRQRDGGEGKRLATLLVEGHAILNPNKKTDGTPDTGKLLPMPPEAKMRLDYDNATQDAFAGLPAARSAAYQSAKAVYAALSAKAGDRDTQTLNTSRWQESIKLAVGDIHSWNNRRTIMPPGIDYGAFKDGLRGRIDSLVASGRLDPSVTFSHLWDMPLVPVGSGRYVFTQGDRTLADKSGKPVVIDFNTPVPYVAPEARAPVPTTTQARTAQAPATRMPNLPRSAYGLPGRGAP